MTSNIYPCIWHNGTGLEAAKFYCNIFKNSKIISELGVVTIYELNGQRYMHLDGGPIYTPTEGISFVVDCANQEEIDYYWAQLTQNGGKEIQCGWLKDKYGVSWQIVPENFGRLLIDPEKSKRVLDAMMKMIKLDMKALENA